MSGMTFASTERHDPYRNFNFSVDFVGKTSVVKSGFNSVTGVKWRADYQEYKEGGNNGIPDQIPTEERFEPIHMRRGMSEDLTLLKLVTASHNGGKGITHSHKMDVIIRIRDRNKKVVRSQYLRGAWISAYEAGDLDAMGMEILFDQITVSFTAVDYE